MEIIFLLNGNLLVGYGHLGRCMNMAHHLKVQHEGARISFCGEFDEYARIRISAFNYAVSSSNFEGHPTPDILIVDSYQLDAESMRVLAKKCKYSIFLDDFGFFPHDDASIVLNFTVNAEKRYSYKAKSSLLGLKYYPSEPKMIRLREKRVPVSDLNNILVFFGGKAGAESFQENVLYEIDKRVMGKKFKLLLPPTLSISVPNSTRNEFITEPTTNHIHEHFEWCDALISGGGLMKYEGGFSRVYNGSFASNSGQLQDSLVMHELGLSYHIGVMERINDAKSIFEIHKNIDIFFHDETIRTEQYKNQTNLFDTLSGTNLARKILNVK